MPAPARRPVPANLLLVPAGVDAAAAVAAIRRAAPEGARWAFLTPDAPAGPGPLARPLPLACPCCVGAVAFRVALVDLLRRAKPDRVIVVAPPGAHPDGTVRALREETAAGLLELRAVLVVLPADAAAPASYLPLADASIVAGSPIPADLLDRRNRA